MKPSNLGGKDENDTIEMPNQREIQVQCFPLYSVLQALNNPKIDYFSLDIEGAEFVVLQSLPWNNVKMDLISIEINHAGDIFPGTRKDIQDFLREKGYDLAETVVIDDFFLHRSFGKRRKKKENEL